MTDDRWNPEKFPKTDLRGNRYGRLLVIRYEKKHRQWLCLCDCGGKAFRQANKLKTGAHKSCGCLVSEVASKSKPERWIPQATERCLYSSYRAGARTRKIEFDITFEEALHLFTSNCYYCGAAPSQVRKDRSKAGNRHFLYNGIDRKNAAKGYVVNNIVAACGQCNLAKGVTNMADFREWLKAVYQHWILKGNPLPRPRYNSFPKRWSDK
jgi:hypothetical protein